MATNYIVIPAEFRRPDNSYCTQCQVETNGECGHFLDARDHYGPYEIVGWMPTGLPPGSEVRERYWAWVEAHHDEIRWVQEHPSYEDRFASDPRK